MRNHLLALVAIFLLPSVATADVLTYEQLSGFANRVMTAVSRGDLDTGFAAIKPYVDIPKAELEALRLGTISQRDQAATRFGKSIGYECFPVERRGQYLARITCVERTEKHALPWRFYFYRNAKGWTLNTFNWNDKINALFPPN